MKDISYEQAWLRAPIDIAPRTSQIGPYDVMRFRDQLPAALRHRFDSFGGYTSAKIEEIDAPYARNRKLAQSDKEFIHIVVFVAALHRFFLEGTKAAQDALEELKHHGINSFAIGSATFAEGSEDLLRGAMLARELTATIRSERILSWVKSNKPLYQIVQEVATYARQK